MTEHHSTTSAPVVNGTTTINGDTPASTTMSSSSKQQQQQQSQSQSQSQATTYKSTPQDPQDPKYNSPGNTYKIFPTTPLMSMPHMKFVWRCECDIAREEIDVGTPHQAGIRRSIANILGGEVSGPEIKGKVLGLGGADWATVVEGTHSMTLDARYTVLPEDAAPIYVQAHGLYRPGPGTSYSHQVESNPLLPPQETVTQEDVEFFSHLRLETSGTSKYNWMNGLICVGIMTCVRERVVIDCYYLTNFPDRKPESVVVRPFPAVV